MTRFKVIAVCAVVACLPGLTGCGTDDGSHPAGTPIPAASESNQPQPGTTAGAIAQDIAAAKLRPCPASERSGAPKPDGLPDYVLACLGEGPEVRLAGLRGVPMVVNVWASWCVPCATELPMMGEVAASAGDTVRFVGIDMGDDRVAALKMAGGTAMGFPSVQDPESKVRAGLKIVGVPATLFVDSAGTIVARVAQLQSATQLRELISTYLHVQVPG